jgi:hypothetical protein
MIDEIARIQSRWQQVEAEHPSGRRKRKPDPQPPSNSETHEDSHPEPSENEEAPEQKVHIDLRV